MIQYIMITNRFGESLTLYTKIPIANGIENKPTQYTDNPKNSKGFILTKVEGLGPVNASINNTELATSDGAIFNSARVGVRNIVLSLLFDLDYDPEELRQLTYKFFSAKNWLDFTISTKNRLCKTRGYVESNTPDIFSKWEGTQISIVCPDPYFHATGTGKTVRTEFTNALFEFPFSNESLNEKLIEFGTILTNNQIFDIVYDGDADVGVIIEIEAETGSLSGEITFANVKTNETMTFDTGKISETHPSLGNGLLEHDIVKIDTRTGSKSAYLTRNGTRYNVLNCVPLDADWFSLHKGLNQFTFNIGSGVANAKITFQNDILYEGI